MELLLLDSEHESLERLILLVNKKMKECGFSRKQRCDACIIIEQSYYDLIKYGNVVRYVAKCCIENSKCLLKFFRKSYYSDKISKCLELILSKKKTGYYFPNSRVAFLLNYNME